MDSRFALQLLSAFVDEALEMRRQLEMEARLEQDPVLRAEVQALRRLCAAIRANGERYSAPDGLHARIRASSAFRAAEYSPPARFDWRRWFDWRPLVSSFGLVGLALLGMNLSLWQPGRGERLMQAAVSSHLQAVAGQRLVDLASADRHVVKPWLSTRLAFSTPVPEPGPVDATLVGGRIDRLEGRSVAAVVYRQRDYIVDAFIWPTADEDAPIATTSLRGFNVSHWSRGGMRYCVVSDLPRAQLVKFTLAFERSGDML
jgi:anti-sigma factor RsiW